MITKAEIEIEEIEIKYGEAINLPEKANVEYNNEEKGEELINWNLNETEDYIPGEYVLSGGVEGYSEELKVKLIVNLEILNIELDKYEEIIKRGNNYSLPEKAKVYYSEDKFLEYEIEWDESQVDVEKVGQYEIVGEINDLKREVKFDLVIKELDIIDIQLESKIFEVEYQGEISLPDKVNLVYENNSIKETSIEWDLSKIDTSKSGDYIIQGITKEYEKTVEIKVVVLEDPVLSNFNSVYDSLWVSSRVTSNIDLPSSIDNVSIEWLSSNENYISKTGIVTRGNDDMTVQLTAKLQSGSYSKEKVFYVKVLKKVIYVSGASTFENNHPILGSKIYKINLYNINQDYKKVKINGNAIFYENSSADEYILSGGSSAEFKIMTGDVTYIDLEFYNSYDSKVYTLRIQL